MTHIANKIVDFNAETRELKKQFAAYIKDTTIPLSERWIVFVSAPNVLKNHEPYTVHFKNIPKDTIGYDCVIHVERYETLDALDLLEQYMYNEQKTIKTSLLCKEYNNLLEEVLEMNLGSFVYDW